MRVIECHYQMSVSNYSSKKQFVNHIHVFLLCMHVHALFFFLTHTCSFLESPFPLPFPLSFHHPPLLSLPLYSPLPFPLPLPLPLLLCLSFSYLLFFFLYFSLSPLFLCFILCRLPVAHHYRHSWQQRPALMK